MSDLLPLIVVVPLVGAAITVALDHFIPESLKNYPAIGFAAATAVLATIVLLHTGRTDVVHWFGGWRPRHGVAIGISFFVDPFGAGFAAVSAVVVTAALIFSWHYMREAPRIYRVLMLVFLAGLTGFALSGDLFNMFVFFELMGVAAYALAGYQSQQLGPLQGAINFAVTNSIAAFMILFGIALVYGRTGALNLAQVGQTLSHRPPDKLVIVAFTLIVAGLLIKSALVPFHLWLTDAYAVSPAPVCMVFAAAMSEVGIYGIARIYWTVFDGALAAHAPDIRDVLLGVGVATALVGAVVAFLQRHVKRLLAYTVVSHVGITLCGIALLDSKGLDGAANLVLSHAFLKGALFLACGVLIREFRGVDELRLHGLGRRLPALGTAFFAAAIGLIGLPFVGVFLGHSLVEDAAAEHGDHWLPPLLMLAAGISSGAILRAGARIFLGWGPREDPLLSEQPPEEPPEHQSNVPIMVTVTAVVALLGIVSSVVPGLEDRTASAAERFRDRAAYAERTLHGKVKVHGPRAPFVLHRPTSSSIGYGLGAGAVALLVAAFGLYRQRLPRTVRRGGGRVLDGPVTVLKEIHSGVIGDYVMWITLGTAVLGGVWALTLRGP